MVLQRSRNNGGPLFLISFSTWPGKALDGASLLSYLETLRAQVLGFKGEFYRVLWGFSGRFVCSEASPVDFAIRGTRTVRWETGFGPLCCRASGPSRPLRPSQKTIRRRNCSTKWARGFGARKFLHEIGGWIGGGVRSNGKQRQIPTLTRLDKNIAQKNSCKRCETKNSIFPSIEGPCCDSGWRRHFDLEKRRSVWSLKIGRRKHHTILQTGISCGQATRLCRAWMSAGRVITP